ncbi:GGDEF domain-containing protein [Rugamonas apoptosis]|uniref:diguanylate cyclase n=1 Tax=Rugamonas apoptosis TaxID=2758570 RepID=A0A7W2FAY0_9BURK|nr:GGDEF domain-containing protein [Rugamonas apoptosis]MBA5688310.1 GGDEF domain-containing protein [Rugamonas apoptosis]
MPTIELTAHGGAGGQIWANNMNLALIHSTVCRDLLEEGELADAVRYCVAQGVEPPVPACSELSRDYERCVERAKETLSDYGWWEKRLKVRDARCRLQESREPLELSQPRVSGQNVVAMDKVPFMADADQADQPGGRRARAAAKRAAACPRHPTKSELLVLLRIARGLMGATDVESVLRTVGLSLAEWRPDAILLMSGDDAGDCYCLDTAHGSACLEPNSGLCRPIRLLAGAGGSAPHRRALTLDQGCQVVSPYTDGVRSGYIALSWNTPPARTVRQLALHLLPGIAELAGVRLGNLLAQLRREDEQSRMQAVTQSRHVAALRASESENVAARELAAQDELTGLQNRRGFLAKSEQCMLIARRQELACAVIFADVDGLKRINDEFGHAAGDALIREVAQLFSSAFRHADVVGRVGGDEFAAFTFDNATPRAIIERIEAKLAQFNGARTGGAAVSLSIGAIRCDIRGRETLSDYLARADAEMYCQKRGSKDRADTQGAQ